MSPGTILKSQFPFDTMVLTQHNSMPYALPGPTDTDSQHTCAVAAAEVRTRPHFHPPAPSSFIIFITRTCCAVITCPISYLQGVHNITNISFHLGLDAFFWKPHYSSPTFHPIAFKGHNFKSFTESFLQWAHEKFKCGRRRGDLAIRWFLLLELMLWANYRNSKSYESCCAWIQIPIHDKQYTINRRQIQIYMSCCYHANPGDNESSESCFGSI